MSMSINVILLFCAIPAKVTKWIVKSIISVEIPDTVPCQTGHVSL